MKTNVNNLDYQIAVIATAAQAIEELYEDLADHYKGEKRTLPFTILVLAQKIREANRNAEAEISELMDCEVKDRENVEYFLKD